MLIDAEFAELGVGVLGALGDGIGPDLNAVPAARILTSSSDIYCLVGVEGDVADVDAANERAVVGPPLVVRHGVVADLPPADFDAAECAADDVVQVEVVEAGLG